MASWPKARAVSAARVVQTGGIFFASGGDGDSAGSGGIVDVVNQAGGAITTHGNGADAILAESIGGGGGTGGGGVALVGLGGTGGSGGNGAAVTVTNSAELQTRGQSAHGILAQSIGGGGGSAGTAVSARVHWRLRQWGWPGRCRNG